MVFVLNFAALTMGVVMISDDTVPSVNKHNTLKEGMTGTKKTDDEGMMKKAEPYVNTIVDVGTLAGAGAAVSGTDPLTGALAMGAGAGVNKAVEYFNEKDNQYARWAGKAAVPAVAFGTVQGMNMMNEGAAAAGDAGNAEGGKPEDPVVHEEPAEAPKDDE